MIKTMIKTLSVVAAVGLIALMSPNANARGKPSFAGGYGGGYGASAFSPGQQFRQYGAVSGYPGASGYAPGHLYRRNGAVNGYHGASGYAPGHKFRGH